MLVNKIIAIDKKAKIILVIHITLQKDTMVRTVHLAIQQYTKDHSSPSPSYSSIYHIFDNMYTTILVEVEFSEFGGHLDTDRYRTVPIR